MYRRSVLRIGIAITICAALLPLESVASLVSQAAQGQSEDRKARPRPGKPEGVLPNLEEVRNQPGQEPEAPPPVPSTMRSKRNDGKPWDGRRVGDPPLQDQTRHAHARKRTTPPPLPDDQFVQNFFTWALLRSPNGTEPTYWYNQLRVAYGQGQTSLKLAAIELGRTLFESAEYAGRNRDAHWYVYDLYKTNLMRDPDPGGWSMWEGLVSSHGREYVRRGFEESGEFATLIANVTPNGSPSSNAASLITARVDPRNKPGNGMLTRDANWSLPLLSLPGRAGLDLGLVLSYSSQVWTVSDPYIYFDEDNGFPSPGFRLGFPTVQRKIFDVQTAKNAYLFITGSGRRVEIRQVGTSNIYDAADSSYLRLIENGATLLVYSTDGTKLSFSEANGEYRCVEIKDRNGNYITINYNTLGQITTISDTLARMITFNYDVYHNLLSITQLWGAQTHQWATFGWTAHTMHPSFGSLRVVGMADNAVLPLLMQVGLPDGTRYNFEYTNAAQVSVIRRYRVDNAQTFYTVYQYESTTTDCPRLSQTRVSAENWTDLNSVPGEVTTYFAVDPDGACRMTGPDNTVHKEYYGTGWQKGLTTLSEVWSGGVKQKWTTTSWTQDNTSVSYELNPRVTETNVYDVGGNRRRTTIDYGENPQYLQYGLPYAVKDYAADGVTEIRHTFYDYNLNQAYLDRRIIGLVSAIHQTDVVSWQRKIGFTYDDPARLQAVPAAATQHDPTYNTSFAARGNLTAVSRWDVTDIVNSAKALTAYTNYYTTGTPKSTTDPAGHVSSILYDDSFSDNLNRDTFAYPTTLTDADGFSSTVKYNFHFGAQTRMQGPPPAGQPQGAIQTITYDNLGRVERTTTENNGAYTRYVYGLNFVQSFSTVNNIADEAYAIQVFDGVGRVIASAGNHPGSSGGYRAQMTIYDLMGRAYKTSNPAEITGAWVPAGDDAAGWLYTQQTYDWQGRPLRTTHPDTKYKEAAYGGCGCAGGTVVTLTDEGTIDAGVAKRRQQRIYSDVFGRTVKTEVLNWQGGTVYSATVNTYNARDQVTQIRQYAGPEGSGTYQDTTMTYDGYGRLKTKHEPEQTAGTATTYNYNSDDTLSSVIDARGAATNYAYNNRHFVSSVGYTVPQGSTIPVPAAVDYAYDAAGNRSSMSDGLGSATYSYNSLSRMTAEARNISQPTTPLSFTINYQYNLAGQLTSITDPNNKTINFTHDSVGRLSAITGPSFGGVTNYLSGLQYRAWGAVRHANYGNGKTSDATYNNRMKAAGFQIPDLISKTYDYYDDGTLKFSSDALDHRFDRLYRWDQAARIKEAYSGAEARGETPTTNRPYKQLYAYDAMGHLTQRTNSSWSIGPSTISDSYTNNRHNPVGQLWQYDNDGNLLMMPGAAYTYDADGRIDTAWSGSSATFGLDGDGKKVKGTEVTWDPVQEIDVTTYSFSIYSSVLGRVLTEKITNDDPNSPYAYYTSTTFVYGDGGVIALQESNSSLQEWVSWEHRDPGNATYRTSLPGGQARDHHELDPTGANQGISSASYQSIPEEGILAPYPATNNPSQPGMTYSIDGVRVSLDDFIQNLLIIFNGGLGLNEALAGQSAKDSNYQRIWVGYEDSGHWETSALSLSPSLAWLGFETQNPQSPKDRLADATRNLKERLSANKGDNPCAKLFGGLEKALKALDDSKIEFRSMGGPISLDGVTISQNPAVIGAITKGKNVTINTDGPFMANNGTLPVMGRPGIVARNVNHYGLDDIGSAAFILAHELGHRTGKLEDDSLKAKDPEGAAERNNQRVHDACFKD